MSKKEKFEETDKEVESTKDTRPYNKIDKELMFDIKENIMMSILHNMKRSDAIDNARHYCESKGLVDIPERRLIQIYTAARDELFNYRLEGIAEEKQKIVQRLYRVGAKAEARGDFANAYKAYNRIAELAGVDKENDDSKVILNFVPVKAKNPSAEEILDAEYTPKKEEDDNN